jgi:abequosyltransferase
VSHHRPVLSICIPTYNRSCFLRESLTSVYKAISGLDEQVEVLVSDNASTDNTLEVVTEFQCRYPELRYNRNPVNVIDKNFFIAASLATGKYVWVFADDDLMEERAVSRVLKEIFIGYNLLILNYSTWNSSFSTLIKSQFFPVSEDRFFNNHNELLKYFSIKPQFISSVVVRKDVLFTLPENAYEKIHEYGFSYILAIYAGIYGKVKALFISDELVRYRGDNSDLKSVSKWYKAFATGTTLMLREIRRYNYSAWATHCAKHQVLKDYIVQNISHNRRSGNNMSGIFKLILPYYALHGYFWMVIVPLLFVPASILNTLHSLLIKFRAMKCSKHTD